VPSAKIRQWVVSAVVGLWAVTAGVAIMCPALATAQEETKTEELSRKAKTKVAPAYPDIARRMSITGVVKLAVVVAPNGTVKSSKAVGGHPVLVNAAMDAMKQWKFESASTESTGIVEFRFQPQN
jgi:TonB family protein